MPVDKTLARADADAAAGRMPLARQRLRGLVGSVPHRVDVRERLAELYRSEGDLAQAGRWSYLSERADPREVAAFERAYPDPVQRMRALAWRGEEDAAGEHAARRLREVRTAAERDVGARLRWEDPRRPERPGSWRERERAGEAGCVVLALPTP